MVIYTDGSHFKNSGSGRLGIGGLLIDNGKVIDKFSQEVDKDFLMNNYGTTDCSNPTMELLAALMALRNFGGHIKGKDVTLKADYMGVSSWMTGQWKINKPYIRKIHDDIIREMKNLGVNVTFTWIRGHQSIMSEDSKWNNEADKLAKGEL